MARAGVQTRDEVLAAVVRLLGDVVGEDYLDEVPVTMDTSFSADLELESIEFVALSEKLQEHFGDDVDFVSWIGDMELEQIIALRVGELVEFIVASTGGCDPAEDAPDTEGGPEAEGGPDAERRARSADGRQGDG